jgi:hypothetical protein
MSRQFRGGGYWIPESLHLGESLVSMTVTCSQCGVVKGSVNHWFLFWSERQGERVCFTPYDLDHAMQREESVKKICGTECLHKAVQKAVERLRISV